MTSQETRPNILLILADDMNWTTVGVFGGPQPSVTPEIDALASDGMMFRRAHVSAGVCQPSRESLMTGLYPAPANQSDLAWRKRHRRGIDLS